MPLPYFAFINPFVMKVFYAVLFAAAIFPNFLYGADTARVSTHSHVVIKTDPSRGYTQYPAWGVFPSQDKSYRKVYLYLEFGCAPGLKCGEWDYINSIYLGRRGGVKGDSLHYELARFITPYGFYWTSAQNWKHGWYFDLTDFSGLLHDSIEIIYQHSGYEGNTDRGWTVTMDFYCVEGTPARIPVDMTRMHEVSAPFGNTANPFKNSVPDVPFSMPSGADMVNFKIIQTGHGMDATENCSEFCSKKRTVKLDNQTIAEENVWRDNCGLNSLYPQAGTWIYDRANWCPGAPVYPRDIFKLISDQNSHSFSMDMEAYDNKQAGGANYAVTTYAQFFKNNMQQHDAALDDILAPSTHFDYLRMNPVCGAPIVRVKNMGSDTIKSLDFEYGKLGGAKQSIWVPCNIAPFETQVLNLEAVYNWSGSGNTFYARITKVNHNDDPYPADNTVYSTITRTPTLPDKICIVFKSNNAASENYYTLKDAWGRVLSSKSNFSNNTIYRDTIILANNVCYTLQFMDDGTPPAGNPLNKDGLDWWANTADGSGYLRIINVKNNATIKNFNPDFGTSQVYSFFTTFNMGVDDLEAGNSDWAYLDVFPNPSTGFTKLYIDLTTAGTYQVVVYDQTGKAVLREESESGSLSSEIELKDLAAGLYTVSVVQGKNILTKKFIVQ